MGILDWFKRKPNLEIVGESKGQETMLTFHMTASEYSKDKNFVNNYSMLIRNLSMWTPKKLPPKLEMASDGGKVLTVWYVPGTDVGTGKPKKEFIIEHCRIHKFDLQTSST